MKLKHPRLALLLLLLMGSLLVGCADMEQRRTAFNATMAQWVGKPLDDLLLRMGPPTRSATLSSGGEILEYENLRSVVVGGGSVLTYQSVPIVTPSGTAQVLVPMQQTLPFNSQLRLCRLLFVVSAERVIQSTRHEGDDCY